MKVYLVTSGEYSDYHVDQVFLDEDKAKHWVAAQVDNAGDHYYDEYCIDEVETADESVDCALKINYLYKIKVFVSFKDSLTPEYRIPDTIPNSEYTHKPPCVFIKPCNDFGSKYFLITIVRDKPFEENDFGLLLYKKTITDQINKYVASNFML